jgi:hypothetical protein
MRQDKYPFESIEYRLLYPHQLWCTKDLRQGRCLISRCAGIYAWFAPPEALLFPLGNPGSTSAGLALIYIGKAIKSGGLSRRLRAHFSRDAGHSNFRLHLGVALADTLNLELLHAHHPDWLPAGEDILSEWLDVNAGLSWLEMSDPQASLAETALIDELDPPLNAKSEWFSTHIAAREKQLTDRCGTLRRSQRRWSTRPSAIAVLRPTELP